MALVTRKGKAFKSWVRWAALTSTLSPFRDMKAYLPPGRSSMGPAGTMRAFASVLRLWRTIRLGHEIGDDLALG